MSAGPGRGRYLLVAGVLAVAAAVAVTAWITAWIVRGDTEPTTQPLDGPPAQPLVSHHADLVAVSFMEAAHAYDLDRAAGMLADDAEIVGSANVDDWREDRAWDEAMGFTLADLSCQEGETTSVGTAVQCSYALNGLGSDELGRGPYGGGTADLVVLGGKITRVEEDWPFLENGFSDEMWEPFEAWVYQQHPTAAHILYGEDPKQTPAEHRTELRLWRENIAEYVAAHR
jgi:hypothetical protein